MAEYALRLKNGEDTAPRVRMGDALALQHQGAAGTRQGLRPDGGGAVTVVAGTMQVQVSPFSAWIDGGVSVAQGGYPFILDATKTLTLADGHATLSRTDTIAAVVNEDAYDGSGLTDATVKVVQGTPGSGAPTLPTNCLPLRDVTVPAGLSTGTGGLASGNLGTDRRVWTAAAGGVVTVASQAARDALGALPGQVVYRSDLDALEVRRSTGWERFVNPGPVAWTAATLQNGWTNYGGSWAPAQYTIRDGIVYVQATISGGTVASGTVLFNLPAGFRPAYDLEVGAGVSGATVRVRSSGNVEVGGGFSATRSAFTLTFPAA